MRSSIEQAAQGVGEGGEECRDGEKLHCQKKCDEMREMEILQDSREVQDGTSKGAGVCPYEADQMYALPLGLVPLGPAGCFPIVGKLSNVASEYILSTPFFIYSVLHQSWNMVVITSMQKVCSFRNLCPTPVTGSQGAILPQELTPVRVIKGRK